MDTQIDVGTATNSTSGSNNNRTLRICLASKVNVYESYNDTPTGFLKNTGQFRLIIQDKKLPKYRKNRVNNH